MNLIIDIGNTRAKLALFDGVEIVEFDSLEYNSVMSHVKLLKTRYNIEASIVSNVGSVIEGLNEYLSDNFQHIGLSSDTFLPIGIDYDTPKSLGVDRRALAVGAFTLAKGKKCLVIDMGSCITYDFVNEDAMFLGGAISPGVEMRFKSMHNFTESLPLVSIKESDSILAKNTEMSLVNGVLFGVKSEIDAYIDEIQKKYGEILIFISGGDHPFFVNKLKNSIFADSKILLKGLNSILNYNLEKINE